MCVCVCVCVCMCVYVCVCVCVLCIRSCTVFIMCPIQYIGIVNQYRLALLALSSSRPFVCTSSFNLSISTAHNVHTHNATQHTHHTHTQRYRAILKCITLHTQHDGKSICEVMNKCNDLYLCAQFKTAPCLHPHSVSVCVCVQGHFT